MEAKRRSPLTTLSKPVVATLGALTFCAVVFVGGWVGALSGLPTWNAIAQGAGPEANLTGVVWTGAAVTVLAGAMVGAGTATAIGRRRYGQRLAQKDRQVEELRLRLESQLAESDRLAQEIATLQNDLTQTSDRASQADRLSQELRDLSQELRQALSQRDQALREAIATHEQDLQDIQANVEQTWDTNAALEQAKAALAQENSELSDYIASLEADLVTLQANLDQAWRYREAREDGAESALGPAFGSPDQESELGDSGQIVGDRQFETVLAAVTAAAEDFGDRIVIWESAYEAAAESLFGRPADVYRALAAIADVSEKYFSATAQGTSMGDWRSHFKHFGLEFKPTEHQVTRTMYGADRTFRHQGRKQQMLKHITLGRNNIVHTLQIYFEVDREAGKLAIGYCGKHLPCYRWAS